MALTPTDEQVAILDAYREGGSLIVDALAGTGKTTVLQMCGAARRDQALYLAFNRSIAMDAAAKMPGNVSCRTIHSRAMEAVGRHYRHRLNGARMRSRDVAIRLGIPERGILTTNEFGQKVLQPGYLAGLAMRSIGVFCQTADLEPAAKHVPWIDGIDTGTNDSGRRVSVNNRRVAQMLEGALKRAWADLSDPEGVLRFDHHVYLKVWQLGMALGSFPKIGRVGLLSEPVLLIDEAQDLNPLMLAIAGYQDADVVWVGDPNQQIYSWMGSVDALSRVPVQRRLPLTRSWRFGPDIAEQANEVLLALGSDLRLWGTPAIDSYVGEVADPRAILCRTNAKAVATLMMAQDLGRRPHLVGGGKEVLAFARGAQELMERGFTPHPELACFESWGEVVTYAEEDELGHELKLLVDLIEKFTVEVIIKALGQMPSEAEADVVVSTAHKAKGREFVTVKLSSDFPDFGDTEKEVPDEERRLLYVAETRAQLGLDVTAVRGLEAEPALGSLDEVWIEED